MKLYAWGKVLIATELEDFSLKSLNTNGLLVKQSSLNTTELSVEEIRHTFSHLSSTSSLSATNSMYWFMRSLFIPIRRTGRASVRNSCSILTASRMIWWILSCEGLFTRWLNIRQAKSQ